MLKLFIAHCFLFSLSIHADVILLEEMVVEGYAPIEDSINKNEWLESKQSIRKTGLNREEIPMGEQALALDIPTRERRNRFKFNLGNSSSLEVENQTPSRNIIGKISRSRVSRSLISSGRTLDQSDDNEVIIKPKNDNFSTIWNEQWKAWTFQLAGNTKSDDIYSGEIFSGKQEQEGAQLDANYQLTSEMILRAGGQWVKQKNQSEVFLPAKQELTEWQTVFGLDIQHSKKNKTEFSFGRGDRVKKAGSLLSRFRRDSYLAEHQNKWKVFENRARVQLLDESNSERKEENIVPLLDSKLTIPLYKALSATLRGHYSHKSPTPKMLAGDGIRVLANPDLRNEEIRLAETGLKFSEKNLSSSLTGFYGRSRHIPLWIGSAGGAARALSVGGAWMQGLRWSGDLKTIAHKINIGFTWQEILNDSAISWQKGNPLPGFARQKASVAWKWSPSRRWETQVRWERKWDIPLSLDGEAFEAYRDTNYLALLRKQKNYNYGLQLENFLISKVPEIDFAGGVGPNLLDRPGQGRVWRLVWEGSY